MSCAFMNPDEEVSHLSCEFMNRNDLIDCEEINRKERASRSALSAGPRSTSDNYWWSLR